MPTASRITQDISSHVANSTNVCTGGQTGWYRQVKKIVTDQNGADIVLTLQALAETVTVGTPNQLNVVGVQTGAAVTDINGEFQDTYFVCSSLCPGTGLTNSIQVITDTYLGSGPYVLSPNVLALTCSNITVNGQ